MVKPGVSIVIPTWNGQYLLNQCLPSVIDAAHSYSQSTGAEVEIIVVDDGSTDGTADWLQKTHPHVITIRKEINEGFAPTCNVGFEQAKQPVILLLNNDVRVETDILFHLVNHFSDSSVFAVCCKALDPETNRVATAGKVGQFKRGFWRVYKNYDVISGQGSVVSGRWSDSRKEMQESNEQPPATSNQITSHQPPATSHPYYSIHASGGFSAFATDKLRQLGGFNPLLAPFYWEDVELSLRAWKRGWIILYEPRAVVYHATSSTIEAHFKRRHIDVIAQRNRLITHWINLHDRGWLAEHLIVVALLLLSSLLTLNLTFWRALRGAVKALPVILEQRGRERRGRKISDRELARMLTSTLDHPWVRMMDN